MSRKQQPQLRKNHVVVVTDTFSLYPISLDKLVEDYKACKYQGMPSYMKNIKKKGNKKITGGLLDETAATSDSNQSDICIRTNITGEVTKTVTTNTDAFKGKLGGRCYHCRRKYQHGGFGYQICPDTYHNSKVFHLVRDKSMCYEGCVYAYLNYIQLEPNDRENFTKWTTGMFRNAYGITDVCQAPDFRLLKENQGTEEYEKWRIESRIYDLRPGRVIVPSKLEFEMIDTLPP